MRRDSRQQQAHGITAPAARQPAIEMIVPAPASESGGSAGSCSAACVHQPGARGGGVADAVGIAVSTGVRAVGDR